MHAAAKPSSRRRFLRILAAQTAVGLTAIATPLWARHPASPGGGSRPQSWNGVALGLETSLHIHHEDPAFAKELLAKARAEALRLGAIFSLFDPMSAISQLNARGWLQPSPRELLFLAETGIRWGALTDGAFDITIQPVCERLMEAAPDGLESFREPSPETLGSALDLVDYRQVHIDADGIRLAKPGAKITLNALAQGYITDQVAALLARHGVEHTLVDIGEKRALGTHPRGRPWRIGLESPANTAKLGEILSLDSRAMASSGGHAEPYSADGLRHHIIEAGSGASASRYGSVTVLGPDATRADALNTALHLVEPAAAGSLLGQFPDFEAIFHDHLGNRTNPIG